MDQRVVRGIPWTFAGFAGTRVVSIGSTIALARLLTPRDFGIAAVGALATGLLTIFSDLGLGGALVLRERDRAVQGTIFSLLLLLGCALAVIGAAVSVPLAALLGDRQAAPVLAAFSATTAVAGLSWFYSPLLQREFRFKAASIARVLAALMTAVVSVIAAVLGAGVWSFVLGQAAGIVASTIVLVAAAPYHVKPRFKLSAVREALKSGRGFVLQGSTAYLAVNADYLIIAKVLGPSALGAYSLAFRYAELPYYAVAEPVAQVTFPGFARMWSRNQDVTRSYLSTLRLVALISCPLGIMLSACAAPLVHTLLGPQWTAAIGPLVALGLWSVVRQVQSTAGWLLNSVGRADSMGLASIVSLLWLFPSVYAAAELIGLVGVALVMLANMVVGLVWCAFLIRRHVGVTLRTQWVALRGIAVSCCLSWLAGWASAAALGGVPYVVALTGSATACAVAYLGGVATMDRPVLRAAINNARRLLDRGPAMSERAAVA